MFDRYVLSAVFKDADATVSVAKMKNHAFMGVTLCMKNLFGLPPITLPEGRVRTYFHHVVRRTRPRVLGRAVRSRSGAPPPAAVPVGLAVDLHRLEHVRQAGGGEHDVGRHLGAGEDAGLPCADVGRAHGERL